jgi:FkbM family methyltransferase
LIDNLRLNRATNVVPYSVALSDRPGILALELESHHTGLNRIATKSGATAGMSTQLTGVLRMDDVLSLDRDSPMIDLVKIDVEGAELKVLRGMQRLLVERRIRRLVVEITPHFLGRFDDSREQLFDYLAGLGFRAKYDLQVAQYDELFELL